MSNKSKRLNNLKKIIPNLLSSNKVKKKSGEAEDFEGASDWQEQKSHSSLDEIIYENEQSRNPKKVANNDVAMASSAVADSLTVNDVVKKQNNDVSNNLSNQYAMDKKVAGKSTSSSSSTLVSETEIEKYASPKNHSSTAIIRKGSFTINLRNSDTYSSLRETESRSGRMSVPIPSRRRDLEDSPVMNNNKKIAAPKPLYLNIPHNESVQDNQDFNSSFRKKISNDTSHHTPIKQHINFNQTSTSEMKHPIHYSQTPPIYDNISQHSVASEDDYATRSLTDGEYQSVQLDNSTNSIISNTPESNIVHTSVIIENVTNNKIYQSPNEAKAENSNNLTPQKVKNLLNVEAFYWKELKKIKEKQDYELYQQTMSANDLAKPHLEYGGKLYQMPDNMKLSEVTRMRCRSVSPALVRAEDLKNPNHQNEIILRRNPREIYRTVGPKRPINENMINPNFVRNSSLRNTIGSPESASHRQNLKYQQASQMAHQSVSARNSLNRKHVDQNKSPQHYGQPIRKIDLKESSNPCTPIFKRGSLLAAEDTPSPSKDKRVSFSKTGFPKSDLTPTNTTASLETHFTSTSPENRENIYGELRKPPIAQSSPNRIITKSSTISRIPYPVKHPKSNVYVPTPFGNYGRIQPRTHSARLAFSNENMKPPRSNVPIRSGLGSESESGSEAGEVRRIMLGNQMNAPTRPPHPNEEDWNPDGKNRDGTASESGRSRSARRDDPRRHTLGGDLLRTMPQHMDQEQSLPRGYPPPSSAMLFDDDPGIMSEVETASTGFRRGGKQRSSLPVVRTPSKTLERPLGLVFLQYRSETKRALLPNEITSIDTVKALFVRSFPKQLTMEYLDSPLVKIYIHDSSKDMFYELEDLRSHLRDIRDRSVLRLFESADVSGGAFPGALGGAVGMAAGGPPGSGPPSWDQDQSYFSEPEFDSEYHHQHIHKSKVNSKPPAYYMGAGPPTTLPRGGSLIRAYSPAGAPPIPADRIKSLPSGAGAPPKPLRAYGSATSVMRGGSERCFPFSQQPVDGIRASDQLYSLPADRIHNDGYMSSPERGSRGAYEEPYYTQYVGPARGGMTPVIDEETGDPSMLDDQYSLYSVKIPSVSRPAVRVPPYDGQRLNSHSEDLQQRMRVEHMERQLANLTGLVQKALQAPGTAQSPRDYLSVGPHFRNASQESTDPFLRTERPPKLGKGRYHKSVSFEKSVSFSDEPPDMNSPKQHSPQHSADTKPPKPAIKSSTLPRMSSQERDRMKPVPPPKPKALVGIQAGMVMPGGPQMVMMQSLDYYNHLKMLRKKCDEFRMDMRNLRRMSLAQSHTMREMICDLFSKFRTAIAGGGDFNFHEDSMRLARDEEIYKQEMLKLEVDLSDLESTVEQLRGNVINRKTRVNMLDVEKMALVLSKSSKTVADLKVRFPALHEGIKNMLSNEMEKVVRQEKFLKEEPERLEMALRRCKKLTGTLVTLKRLASVQEQRLPCEGGRMSPGPSGMQMDDQHPHNSNPSVHSKTIGMGSDTGGPGGMASLTIGGSITSDTAQRTENALDALLDELQTFARPPSPGADGEEESGLLRRLRSCASISGESELSPPIAPRGQTATKPPVPERNPDLLQMAAGRRAPPPPPPRTSSRSPIASPAAPLVPLLSPSNSSSCDSVDSQEQVSKGRPPAARQDQLEQRHQELLKKQRALQEQYARLQQIQRGGSSLTVVPPPDLKKTGSESNLLSKMGLNMTPAAPISGSLNHLAGTFPRVHNNNNNNNTEVTTEQTLAPATSTKVYETDIL